LIIHEVSLDPIKDLIIGRAIDFEVGRHALGMLTIDGAADGSAKRRTPVARGYAHNVVKMVSNGL